MDDMYQYASSAVNSNQSNNSNDKAEENDIVLQAFNNFGWSQRFNSLLDTVKKQSEAIVDVTRKDLEEFAHSLREDNAATPTRDMSSSAASSSTVTTSTEKAESVTTAGDNNNMNDTSEETTTTGFAALRESLNKISAFDMNSLREGLGNTLNQSLPTQLTSVRLPENIDINQLKTEMAQGTRFAEQYLSKFGTEVVDVLSKTITVLEPDNSDEGEQGGRTSGESARRIFATRKDSLLAKMRANPDTYLQDPVKDLAGDDKKLKVLETFNAGFSIDSYTEEISRLLDEYPEMREMMNDLVPVQVNYTSFWQRYFYHVWSIEQDEQKRQLIVKGVDDDDDADFKWDSDDEDMTQQKPLSPNDPKNKGKASSDGKGSDTEFSNISEPVSTEPSLVSPPLKSQTDGEDWVKADMNKNNKTDSDSDWE
ncbi:hypothetical protein BDA99DRAFT_492424 [Phascolomyces articulosus]|uniref:BSD domain-containing protein n=1 Tax=Phascolomyces articulosus TaxID=60185 RepID=A0AAD5KRH9_9FUNG|nr:hypothetical protein BDA99DRAFT_492424 [Phascolomyces articulosus]